MIELLLVADRHLEAGDLDGADRLYAQVAQADPRNAIAVVGLARVALGQGDLDVARALVGRALAIDPEDGAARQLRDVLAIRDGPIAAADVPPTAATMTEVASPPAAPPEVVGRGATDRRGRPLVVLAIAAALVLGIVLAILAGGGFSHAEPASSSVQSPSVALAGIGSTAIQPGGRTRPVNQAAPDSWATPDGRATPVAAL